MSNGPGNPEMCMKTVEQLRLILAREPAKPLFGICFGHQLLSLAAGASTYKMKSVSRSLPFGKITLILIIFEKWNALK